MAHWYNARKAAQIAAYFALREGGRISVLKAVKLIYLADRKFMEKYDSSLVGDNLVSMDHGPVNSTTLNSINGLVETPEWNEFVSDRDNHDISLANDGIREDALDELSRAELSILDATWSEFGHMTKWQIRDYTHDNCPEWEDPNGSSIPIPFERVMKLLGKKSSQQIDRKIRSEMKLFAFLRD